MKIGIDIGGSHISIGVVENGNTITQKIEKDLILQQNKKNYIFSLLKSELPNLINNEPVDLIGISAPGIPNGTTVEKLENLQIDKLDFKFLEDEFHTKITTINDGNAATIAEKKFGALKPFNNGVFLCLGTGIGGGAIIDNNLFTTSKSGGFEIGHMVIERNGLQCNCGKKGCFEKYCGMKPFREQIISVIEKNSGDKDFLQNKYLNDVLMNYIHYEDVQKIIDEYINNLIIGFSNIIDIFEPDAICLGGSFSYYKQYLYDKLVTEMNNRKYAFYNNSIPQIVIAEFKNDAGIIGAVNNL